MKKNRILAFILGMIIFLQSAAGVWAAETGEVAAPEKEQAETLEDEQEESEKEETDSEETDGEEDENGLEEPEDDWDYEEDVELLEYIKEAREELAGLAGKETLMALVYLCDSYEVKDTPDFDGKTVENIPSGAMVIIKGMEVDEDYNLWLQVSFEKGGTSYEGYVEREYLAYSNEQFIEWENTYFPKIAMFAAVGGYPDIEQFPASYRDKLVRLKQAHPNWIFVRQNTNLNWQKVVSEECYKDRSLIHSSMGEAYRREQHSPGWYYASEQAVKYYLDPRNFLDESRIFQFEQLTYNPSYHSKAAVQNILKSTFMKGEVPGAGMTYAEAFFQIGVSLKVSPFHLACRVYQEQGEGKSALISGNYTAVPEYKGYYNYYNIGASGTTTKQVVESGLARAVKEGWNTHYASLKGGAGIIAKNYILRGQDTLYLQKFDVDSSDGTLYTHQYMQNITAPYTESSMVRRAYVETNSLDNPFVFKIPVYNDMPSSACQVPSQSAATPTAKPTATPTAKPTATPTVKPTATPTAKPTAMPTATPTAKPTEDPTTTPTAKPGDKPTATPAAKPTTTPTAKPAEEAISTPTVKPTIKPTAKPTAMPTAMPTARPTAMPTAMPTAKPTAKATAKPAEEAISTPTVKPTARPTEKPTATSVPASTTAPAASEAPAVKGSASPTPSMTATVSPASATDAPKQTPEESPGRPSTAPSMAPTAKPASESSSVKAPGKKTTPAPTQKPVSAPAQEENDLPGDGSGQNERAGGEQAQLSTAAPTAAAASDSGAVPSAASVAENTSSSGITVAASTPKPHTLSEDRETVTMDMSKVGMLYAQTLKQISEQGAEVVLKVSDEVNWTIDGSLIDSEEFNDIDLKVTLGSSRIPEERLEILTKNEQYVEMSLAHDGEFGFTMQLSVALEDAQAGQFANLFYYDEEADSFEFMCASEISSSKEAVFEFKHASDYVIIISNDTKEGLLAEKAEEFAQAKQQEMEAMALAKEETPAKEPVKAAGIIALILLACAAAGIAVYLIVKRKE